MEEKFTLIAKKMDITSMKMVGATITIDFTKFQPRKCKGKLKKKTKILFHFQFN